MCLLQHQQKSFGTLWYFALGSTELGTGLRSGTYVLKCVNVYFKCPFICKFFFQANMWYVCTCFICIRSSSYEQPKNVKVIFELLSGSI